MEKYSSANPDNLNIYDNNGKKIISCYWYQDEYRAMPYAYTKMGELIVGYYGQGHDTLASENGYRRSEELVNKGRFWLDEYITNWNAMNDDEWSRDLYRELRDDFKMQHNQDIGNFVILFEDRQYGIVTAIKVNDYISGKNPVPFTEFDKEPKAFDDYKEFANPNDPDDCDLKRRERMRIWNGRDVAESIEKEDIATPDRLDITQSNGKRISQTYMCPTCYPFGIVKGKLYVGKFGKTHYDIKKGIERDDYDIAGRIFMGKNYKILTLWEHQEDDQDTRDAVKTVYSLFRVYKGLDIGDYTFLLYDYGNTVYAATVKDYIRGYELKPYTEYEEFEKNPRNFIRKTKYDKFSNPNDPDDDDFHRIQRFRLWNGLGGLEVAESIKRNKNKKNMKISESQLKKMIAKSIKESIGEQDFRWVDNLNNYVQQNNLQMRQASKFQRINARPATPGEQIKTIATDGTSETVNTAKQGDMVVNNVSNPNNQWIIDGATFQKKYVPVQGQQGVYMPKGGPMNAAQINEPISFNAPWGEKMNIDKGGYILQTPDNPNDIYGISGKDFDSTYRFNDLQEQKLKKMIAKSIKEAISEMDADRRSQLLNSFYSDAERRRMPKQKYPFKEKPKYETDPVKQDKKNTTGFGDYVPAGDYWGISDNEYFERYGHHKPAGDY